MRVAVLIALAGCYSPAVRDCVLPCSSDADCASGQTCSAGVCTTAGMSCADPQTTADGAVVSPPPPSDATVVDDARPVDAPATAYVAINIAMLGTGSVTIGSATCSAACTVQVPADQPIVAVAVGKGSDVFGAWTSAACHGETASCSFTPTTTTPLDVWFVKKSGNGP